MSHDAGKGRRSWRQGLMNVAKSEPCTPGPSWCPVKKEKGCTSSKRKRGNEEEPARLARALQQPIEQQFIHNKPNRGQYITGGYVVWMLNEIFGPGNWKDKIEEKTVGQEQDGTIWCEIRMTLKVKGWTSHSGLGFASKGPQLKRNPAELRELAVKSAETDALKRCAKKFGEVLGNHLSKKSKTK